jgi:SAM-dependent methyltransferase
VAAARRISKRVVQAADQRIFPLAPTAKQHWLRIVMDRRVREFIVALEPSSLTAVEISGNAHASDGWKSFHSLNYPDFDICTSSPPDEYDVVICEQVLEHVADPWGAVRNLAKLCRPEGHVVITVPFLVKVHELPLYGMHDYWRFTPRGLRLLLEGAGLEVVSIDTWGNRLSVLGNLDRWSAHRWWLPLGNRKDTPVQVWAFARRPGS